MSVIATWRPIPPAAIATSNGTGTANLLTPEPKEIWAAAAVTSTNIDIDFGANIDWDTIFVGFTNAHNQATWIIRGGAAGYTDATYKAAGDFRANSQRTVPRRHGYYRHPTVVTGRYVRLVMTQIGALPLRIGIVAVGKSWQPFWPQEYGHGRIPIDTGARERLRDGGFGRDPGVLKWGYRWRFGDLTDLELAQLEDIVDQVGVNGPIVVVEDPDPAVPGLNERIHYSVFDRFEHYDRQDANLNRWGLVVEEWV